MNTPRDLRYRGEQPPRHQVKSSSLIQVRVWAFTTAHQCLKAELHLNLGQTEHHVANLSDSSEFKDLRAVWICNSLSF